MASQATSMESDDQNIFSEFHDPDRQDLVKQIMKQDPQLSNLSRLSFFALWFCDIAMLKRLAAASIPQSEAFDLRYTKLSTMPYEDYPGILAGNKIPQREGNKRKKTRGSSQSLQLSGNSSRNTSVKDEVLKRDRSQCVLTKHGRTTLHVAHIVPYKLHSSQREEYWRWLGCFWDATKIAAWRSRILGEDGAFGTEQIQNMLALAPALHTYWDQPICAFRPISVNEDKTSMDVAFHWLPLPDKSIHCRDRLPLDEHPYPGHPTGFRDSPGDNIFLFDMNTKLVISSGHIFTIKTDDPEKRPLPSFELLEMQWYLTRIVTMQGAGEDDDSEMDSDGDVVTVPSRSRSRSPEKWDSQLGMQENVRPSRSRVCSAPSAAKLQELPTVTESSDFPADAS